MADATLLPTRCCKALDEIRSLLATARTDAVDMVERIQFVCDQALARQPPSPMPAVTDAMIEAGIRAHDDGWHDKSKEWEEVIADIYLAMQAASTPLQVTADDVPVRSPEGAVKIDGASVQPGLEVTTPRARTISQKPHQPSLTALQVTEGDEVGRLIEARKVVAKEYRRLGLNPNPVLRGDFDAGVEVQAALRSQYNTVSKP